MQMSALGGDVERSKAELEAARAALTSLHERAAHTLELGREYERPEPEAQQSDEERLRLENELTRVRAEIASAQSEQSMASAAAADLRERASAFAAERDAANARLGMLDQDSARAGSARERMLAEVASLMAETRTAHAHLEGLRRGVTDLDGQVESARSEREELAAEQTRIESEARAAEASEREEAAGGERDRTRLAQIEAELGMLVSQFAQHPATNEECADVETRYRGEADSVVDELPRLRDELVRLEANVNLNAQAERDEVAEREAFLRAQLDDLAQARRRCWNRSRRSSARAKCSSIRHSSALLRLSLRSTRGSSRVGPPKCGRPIPRISPKPGSRSRCSLRGRSRCR